MLDLVRRGEALPDTRSNEDEAAPNGREKPIVAQP